MNDLKDARPYKETLAERILYYIVHSPGRTFALILLVVFLTSVCGLFARHYLNLSQDSFMLFWFFGLGVFVVIITFAFVRLIAKAYRDNLLKYISGPEALRTMSARGLENLMAAIYESQGYKIRRNPTEQPDGGIDLKIYKDGKCGLVQCKKWTHDNVGVDKIRELCGVMQRHNADFGVFVTTSDFTEPAEKEAKGFLEIINHAKLWDLVQHTRMEDVVTQEQRIFKTVKNSHQQRLSKREPLLCPKCGDRLILKEKDTPFLGCKSYGKTKCNYTFPLVDGRRPTPPQERAV